jgi:hypothetical protein
LARANWWLIAGIAAFAVLAAGVSRLSAGPSFVDQITIDNPSAYAVTVEATNSGRHGWLGLTTIDPRETRPIGRVLNQGDRWVFRFAAQGQPAGEIELNRAELSAAGWKLVVPATVLDQLRAKGVPPTP